MGKERPNFFADWLKDALGQTSRKTVVERSGLKSNGRPVIDESRLSKWLSGAQRPSMENAAFVARILRKPESEALIAAGYAYGHSLQSIERMRDEKPVSVGGHSDTEDSLLFRRPEGLSDEAWERLQESQKDHWEWLIERAAKER